MTINWQLVFTALFAAATSVGGTLGLQKATGPTAIPPAFAQQLTLVEGMTGLCIRVEKAGSAK